MASSTRTVLAPLLLSCAVAVAAAFAQTPSREPIVGGPCEGCEAVFEGLPASVSSSTQIASASEPGERLLIEGTVRDPGGAPVAGVIVYAYHTDNRGIYPRLDNPPGAASGSHGRLRGWAKSDDLGRFSFDTIRPAGYPETSVPAHVHLHVIEPGRCTYYIDNLHFEDDPRFTSADRRRLRNRGGSGLVQPARDSRGTWRVTRDIILGDNIPQYPAKSYRLSN